MPHRLQYMGAPQPGGAWLDDAVNTSLKAVMAAAHRTVWHRRALLEFQQLKRGRD